MSNTTTTEVKPSAKKMTAETLKVYPYILQASKDRNVKLQSGQAMKLAVFRFLMHEIAELGIEIKDTERKSLWTSFNATAGWFGSNASAGGQAMGVETSAVADSDEFLA